jgi:hypothetical protein
MIWSDENELKTTLKKVEDYCVELKAKGPSPVETPDSATSDSSSLAPGAERDQLAHKNEEISLDPVGADPNYKPSAQNRPEVSVTRAKMCMGGASLKADEDSRTPVLSEDKDSSDEDTEKNVAQPTASDDGASVASADDVEQDVESQFADAE